MRAAGCFALLLPLLLAGPVATANVILISLDTTRADSLGSYGCPLPITPFMDALSRESILLEDCIVQAPWTLPSHMSMLTGQYPSTHNVNVSVASLAPEKLTLQEHMQSHGYRTVGLQSNPFLNAGFGFKQGFDTYRFVGKDHGFQSSSRARTWLEENGRDGPFFMFLHFNDPHIPYQAPGEHYKVFDRDYQGSITGEVKHIKKYVRAEMPARELQHVRSLYRDEVRYLDGELAKVFRYLKDIGIYEESLIIVTSDHGEEFKEHGMLEHNQKLYDEMLRVPLLIKPPARLGLWPRTVSAQVRSIDLMPTILDMLDLPIPTESVQGISLLPLLRDPGEAGSLPDQIISESSDTRRVSIRSRGWKFIYSRVDDESELYDLVADPAEQRDLTRARPEMAAELLRQAREYVVQAQSGWHIRSRYPGSYRVVFQTPGQFVDVQTIGLEPRDKAEVTPDGRQLQIELTNLQKNDKFDGVDFRLEPPDARLELILPQEAVEPMEDRLARIRIGRNGRRPESSPVRLNGRRRDLDPDADMNNTLTIDVVRREVSPGLYIWRLTQEAASPAAAELDEETLEGLKSLGYLQ